MLGEPIKPITKLSEKEQKLFDFIEERGEVTVAIIKVELGDVFLGVLGGLKSRGVISAETKKDSNTLKFVKFFKMEDKIK